MKCGRNSHTVPDQPFSPNSFQTFGDLLKYLRRRERLTQLELSIAVVTVKRKSAALKKISACPI